MANEKRAGAEDYVRLRLLAGRQAMSDPPRGAEVEKMNQKEKSGTEQDGIWEEFKQKVAAWERMGIFDRIPTKIDECVEEPDMEQKNRRGE